MAAIALVSDKIQINSNCVAMLERMRQSHQSNIFFDQTGRESPLLCFIIEMKGIQTYAQILVWLNACSPLA